MTLIGYARTSAFDGPERLTEQVAALRDAGCVHVVEEVVRSIADPQPTLERTLMQLDVGDVLVATALDRIVPSLFRLSRLVSELSTAGASLRVLDIGLESDTLAGRQTLTIFKQAADFERAVRKARQMEGVSEAKAAGRFKGQAPTAARQAAEVLRLSAEGKSGGEIARLLGIGRSSVARIIANPDLARRIAAGEPGASWSRPKPGD